MIVLSGSGALTVVSGPLSLTGGWPMVDGHVYRDAPTQVTADAGGNLVATYNLGPAVGRFVLTAAKGGPDGPTLQYTVGSVPAGKTFTSFGVKFDAVAGLKRYYRSGYHSWDGSSYVQPDGLVSYTAPQLTAEVSYALTQLVPPDGQAALVMGFDRHDRYQQTFTFGVRRSPPDLAIATFWDQKTIDPTAGAASEKLWLLQDSNYEEGLRRWARIAAAASPMQPRTQNSPLIGWDTWYNLYNFINEPLVGQSLTDISAAATQQHIPLRTFLIDAGFTPELGDWLDTTYAFPNGMAPLLNNIQQAGFAPGLWIAPLLVGNRSQLYTAHPDWVLKDVVTGKAKLWASFYGEQRLGNMRSEEYYVLDTTVPAAFDYLRTVFHTWRRVWGVTVFKVDFSYLGADWGPDQVRYSTTGMTRIEVWRRFAEMVRQEIGDDAIWVASGQPLWASIGLADTIRISGDVGVSWYGTASAQALLNDLPVRNFANHILWQIDPDAVLLRTGFHNLTDTEVRSLAVLAGMSGGVMTTSDDLLQLPPERMSLWRMLLSDLDQNCAYPRSGRDDIVYVPYSTGDGQPPVPIAFSEPVIVQVRSLGAGRWIVHALNTSAGSLSRNYSLADLGISGPQYVWDWWQANSSPSPVTQVSLTMDAHSGALLYLAPQPIDPGPIDLAGNMAEKSLSKSRLPGHPHTGKTVRTSGGSPER
jgi:hypothetical protein